MSKEKKENSVKITPTIANLLAKKVYNSVCEKQKQARTKLEKELKGSVAFREFKRLVEKKVAIEKRVIKNIEQQSNRKGYNFYNRYGNQAAINFKSNHLTEKDIASKIILDAAFNSKSSIDDIVNRITNEILKEIGYE